jgi:hypothetical protein
MPALAVPGDQAWDSAWALGFEDRDVTIVMDADRAGRLAAQRIQRDLTDVARTVTIADLAPDRQDGYDLTDWLHGHRHLRHHTLQCMLLPDVSPTRTRSPGLSTRGQPRPEPPPAYPSASRPPCDRTQAAPFPFPPAPGSCSCGAGAA